MKLMQYWKIMDFEKTMLVFGFFYSAYFNKPTKLFHKKYSVRIKSAI
jgi:hypothetical protein